MLQGCRLPVFEEVEEGLDGRQPDIACHRRVLALILKIFQKGTDEADVEHCSSVSADGETFEDLFAANTKSNWKLRGHMSRGYAELAALAGG